ncbi:MAG: hypothetical protein IRZ32_12830 [Solirubrobacteraceae bacterium]|nr:hypothetical protein [Solirubrobacteraceae bacterium]
MAAAVEDAVSGRRRIDLARALERLAALGPPSELIAQAPAEAAEATGLGRVVLTRLDDGTLVGEAAWSHEGPEAAEALLAPLRAAPLVLEYPVAESELLRRRTPRLIVPAELEARRRHAFGDALGADGYVAAPVTVDGRAIGFLHAAGPRPARPLDDGDAVVLGDFALCFALVFERAILRRRLRAQREELRQIAAWAESRSGDLADGAVTLAREGAETPGADLDPAPSMDRLRDLLTRRELEVLQLMVQGHTNAGIAKILVLSEGTVKFHVKNVLRKMHANNRAEATSRYLRITLGRGPAGP